MIASFGDKATSDWFHGVSGHHVRKSPIQIHELALHKPDVLNVAQVLGDLRSPLGDRLESPKGNLKAFSSIRSNSQWRIIFCWVENSAIDVQVVDYH